MNRSAIVLEIQIQTNVAQMYFRTFVLSLHVLKINRSLKVNYPSLIKKNATGNFVTQQEVGTDPPNNWSIFIQSTSSCIKWALFFILSIPQFLYGAGPRAIGLETQRETSSYQYSHNGLTDWIKWHATANELWAGCKWVQADLQLFDYSVWASWQDRTQKIQHHISVHLTLLKWLLDCWIRPKKTDIV